MSAFVKIAVCWVTLFVVGTELFVISPLLPSIAAQFGISAALAGLSVTLFSLTYCLSAPLLGHVADRMGRRKILTICLLAFAASNFATAFAGSLPWLLAARLVSGAIAAGITPSVYAFAGDAGPPERRATMLAIVVTGLLTSLSIGAPIGALIGAAFGWASVFVVLAVLSLALAWVNWQVWPADRRGAQAASAGHDSVSAALLVQTLLPTLLWGAALYGMYTFLGAGLTELGYPTAEIAEVILVYGIGATAGALLGGRLADRFGAGFITGTSLAGLAVCFVVLRLFLHDGLVADLMFGLTSVVAQLFFPAQQARLIAAFASRRATVLAWNNSAFFLGISLGSFIGGEAMMRGGFTADLTVSAAIAFCGWAVNLAIARRRSGAPKVAALPAE